MYNLHLYSRFSHESRKKNCLQVYLKECKYEIKKKMPKLIDAELKLDFNFQQFDLSAHWDTFLNL